MRVNVTTSLEDIEAAKTEPTIREKMGNKRHQGNDTATVTGRKRDEETSAKWKGAKERGM